MSDHTPLPDPTCGAVLPGGETCPSDSTVTVASEYRPTGNARVVWRCPEHVAEAVETTLRVSPDSVVTVTPLTAFDHADEPSPDPPASGQPPLHLVRQP